MKYVINGKFLSQQQTGVQRMQYELIKALDNIIDDSDDITLLTPPDAREIPLRHIKVVKYGKLKGVLWEQINLLQYELRNKATGINLGNVAPFIKPDIVCIHDMNVKANPHFYSAKYRIWNNAQFFNIFRRAKMILTVSEFSKNEINRIYKNLNMPVEVVKNAWQHFEKTEYDENALNKYGLTEKEYYFALSSMAPNKNFNWIQKVAASNPDDMFVIAGMKKNDIYGDKGELDRQDNVKCLGYVSDGEAKELMKHSRAFLFPTLYEGFGIPPLEALSTGTDVIVSDTPCMHEVLQDAAEYIDPCRFDYKLDSIKGCSQQTREKVLNMYGWDKSAKKLYEILKRYEGHATK